MHYQRTVYLVLSLMGTLLVACTDLFIMPDHEPGAPSSCSIPPLLQNIIGTWRVGLKHVPSTDTIPLTAPFNTIPFEKTGRLVFGPNGRMSDPDSLFNFSIQDFGPVLYKTYSQGPANATINAPADEFVLWLYARGQREQVGTIRWAQAWPLGIIANRCNRIQLKGGFELVMVR